MKKLKNKKAYADVDFSINLSISHEDEHGELVELEDVEALDFLETIGYGEIVMQKIWGYISDGCYWGKFDIEYDYRCWVSIDWDICGNAFTVSYNDCADCLDLRCIDFDEEFGGIFDDLIDNVLSHATEKWRYLCFYWEAEIDLDDYPNILDKIEKAGA